jgi:G3E family GTPase
MKLFLVGGFLGSGKTTAIVNACQHLLKNNYRVAVITNDQGDQQVDTALVKSFGIPAAEVANGCFCCNYDQLDKHINSLIANEQPDIIFAESVGSCTDIIATVAKPFQQAMSNCSVVISVFTDAGFLLSLFECKANFISENIQYIYKKQLEEADILIINKADLVSTGQLSTINSHLIKEFPEKILLYQNSFQENDIKKWIDTLFQYDRSIDRSSINIDYDRYGDGEAQLAWLDQSLTITAPQKNAVTITKEIVDNIYTDIKQQQLVIGHLKFFIETPTWKKKVSLTTTSPLTYDLSGENVTSHVHLLINARVETEPAILQQIVNDTLKQMVQKYDCNINVEKWAAFKPGYPKPLHRIS